MSSPSLLIQFDEYLEAFAAKEDQVDKIVNETMRDFR